MSLQAYTPYTYSAGFKYGEFHHAVLSISGTTHTLYLDGSAVNINPGQPDIFSTYSTITNTVIGAQTVLTQAFKGLIGDVRIYNYAISASQVSSLYLNRNLVIHYPFDTSVNKFIPNYGTMLYDASMVGSVAFTTGLSLTNSTGTKATQYVKSSPQNWLLNSTGAGLTISCWINTDGASTGNPMRIFDLHGLAVDILETNKINSSYIPPGLPPTDNVMMYYPLTSFNSESKLFNFASGVYEGTNQSTSIDNVTKAFSTGSLKFTSNNQRYLITNFSNTDTKCTISVWFYVNTYGYIFSADPDTNYEIQINTTTTGKLVLLIQNGGYVSTDSVEIDTISLNTWYHLAWVVNGTNWSVYLNNKLYSKSSMKTLPIIGRTSYFGSNSTFSLIGNIQDFRVYNRDLTATEVSALYTVPYNYPATDYLFNYPLTTISPTAGSQFLNTKTGAYVGTAYYTNAAPAPAPTISNSVYINPPGSLELSSVNNNYVQLSNYTNSSRNISISIWFRLKNYPYAGNPAPTPTGGHYPYIFTLTNYTGITPNNSPYYIGLYINASLNTLAFYVKNTTEDSKVQSTPYVPKLNEWIHFVWVINENSANIYINGSFYNSYTINSPDLVTRKVFLGTALGSSHYFDGYLQNFRIYDNKLLTAAEVSSLYYYYTYYNAA